MEKTILLEHPTRKITDTEFRSEMTGTSFKVWERTTLSDISFEDKILLEKARDDVKKGRLSSHKRIMKLLDN